MIFSIVLIHTCIFVIIPKHYIKEVAPTIILCINSDIFATSGSRPSAYQVSRLITRSNLVSLKLNTLKIILHLVITLVNHLVHYTITIGKCNTSDRVVWDIFCFSENNKLTHSHCIKCRSRCVEQQIHALKARTKHIWQSFKSSVITSHKFAL